MTVNGPVLLRHASTVEPAGQCTGQMDLPLDACGRACASSIYSRWVGPAPKWIFSSDLVRARDTAAALPRQPGSTTIYDPRLREISLGQWQGQTWDDLYRENPEQLDHWGQHWLDSPPPGGESGRQLFARVQQWYIEQRHLLDANAVVVAHAGSLRALSCLLQGLAAESMFDYQFHHCAPLQLLNQHPIKVI